MNKLALAVAVVVALQLLGGCLALVRTDPVSLQKYDEISKCARDADAAGEVNTLRTAPLIANCRERFKDVVITAEFDDLSYVPGGASFPAGSADGPLTVANGGVSLHLRARADGSHVTCWLDPSQKKDELAALSPGDMVTFKGSFKRRLVGENRSVAWEYFDFSPCELLSVKKAGASP